MNETSSNQNPYIVGRPVAGNTLYGREDVFCFVKDTLAASEQNAVVLYGQRRAGKTSILRELPNRLSKEKFHFTFFDLQGQATLDLGEVLYKLATAITESLKISPPNQKDFEHNKDYFRRGFLPQIRKVLGDRCLLLLFDEFEIPSESQDKEVRDKAEHEFYPYMRDLMDKEKDLAFVFVVGRRIDDLTHWVKRVFKEAQYKKIGLLKKLEAKDLITQPVKNHLTYQPEAINSILDLTSGHPFFTQLICFELFNHAQKNNIRDITPDDVNKVVEPALESGELAFSWLWDAISDSGRIYLAAVAYIRGENQSANQKTIKGVLKRFRIRPGADWNSVPRELVEWDVLRDDTTDIQFVVKLVELWIRRSHAPRNVKIVLMNEGESQFDEARNLAQQGKYEEATKALRDLLTINPNHLRAQLTLAQTLLDQKKLKEAVQAFEDAFWMDEDVGRDGLVDARLIMAQELEAQGQFLEAAVHYRRVLELNPEEYRVKEKLDILYNQGRKAAASGDWENAAALFERITNIDKAYIDAHRRRDEAYTQIDTHAVKTQTKKSSSAITGVIIVILALVIGGAGGGWFIWDSLQGTSTPVVQVTTPSVIEPTEENTPTPTPTHTPTTPAPQASPSKPAETEEPTEEPTQETTTEATEEATMEPTTEPTEEATTEPTPTPVIIVVTVTSTPTPILPSYPQPQLINPPNLDLTTGEGRFTGRPNRPRLEWEPAPEGLAENDFYTISVSYVKNSVTIYGGATIKETGWDVPLEFFDDVSGPNKDFTWYVVVSHFKEGSKTNEQGLLEPIGEGVEVSPRSEVRMFRWD